MRRADYERKADEAVQGFVTEGVPLERTIVKIARRDSLNPEQIRRVVEMANTGTFLELFNKTAGEDDRMVEFSVADPESVIEQFYESSPEKLSKVAALRTPISEEAYYASVEDENTPREALTKAASKEESGVEDPRKLVPWQVALERSRKVASSLEDKICEADILAGELADKVASSFRGIYSREEYPKFEKEAFLLYGSDAAIPAIAIRRRLGMPSLEVVPSAESLKTASYYAVVDKTSKGMPEVGEYLKQAGVVSECTQALEAISARINKLQWGKYRG
jgi:hypothetical protein